MLNNTRQVGLLLKRFSASVLPAERLTHALSWTNEWVSPSNEVRLYVQA